MAGTVLIAGATGLVGAAAVKHFDALPGWQVVALSRRRPDYPFQARYLALDLTDRAACQRQLSELHEVTHVVYAALFEKGDVVAGWRDPEQMRTNDAMLRNLMDPLLAAAADFRHISLMQGAKAYGVHVHHFAAPAKERWPRDPHDNFYWLQEDYVRQTQARAGGWCYTIFRPHVVVGFAPRSPINIVAAMGAYAAIQRELGQPLTFPGGPPFVQQMSDSRLIARAFAWAAEAPSAANQTFNIANGDIVIWQHLWPAIVRHFGMAMGPAEPRSLAQAMPALSAVWERIIARHGLRSTPLDALIGSSWIFADFVLGHGKRPSATVLSTVKLQQAGFGDCLDSEDALIDWFRILQEQRILPR
ncbi:MAG: SDR family oxidoreductase [Alphaproteobacteria bacterium]|nr:SDR family oxidoreductase [Alphaproteobacteria bacterium]